MFSGPNRTVLVAGASGVIGRRLCRLLVEDGWRVFGTTRSQEKAETLAAMGVAPLVIDVFDAAKLKAALVDAKPAIVAHMLTDLPPALEPAAMAAARVRNAHIRDIGTRNLIAAALAAGAQRMVAQSVCFAYAPGPTPYPEDRALNAGSIPGSDGVIARGVIALERQVLGAPLTGVVLRFGRFYGPETGLDAPPAGGNQCAARAASEMPLTAFLSRLLFLSRKAEASSGMSSGRSRREGSGTGTTFRR